MTISAIISCIILTACLIFIAGVGIIFMDGSVGPSIAIGIGCALLIIAMWCGVIWYFNNTASGQRALVDQQTELSNGLERTINIYTANGDLIATYTGKIDLEDNDGGYVLFDWNGKRYTYYNCFVESIADIEK